MLPITSQPSETICGEYKTLPEQNADPSTRESAIFSSQIASKEEVIQPKNNRRFFPSFKRCLALTTGLLVLMDRTSISQRNNSSVFPALINTTETAFPSPQNFDFIKQFNPDRFHNESPVLPEQFPPLTCHYDQVESERFEKEIHDVLNNGGRLRFLGGSSSGTYLVEGPEQENGTRETLALFKPDDEQLYAHNNRHIGLRGTPYSSESVHFLGVDMGLQAKKNEFMKRLDYGSYGCTPTQIETEIESDAFFNVDESLSGSKQTKSGILVKWLPHAYSAIKLDEDIEILDRIPLEEFQKLCLLNMIGLNGDFHLGNLLISYEQKTGTPHTIPIDWDLAMSTVMPQLNPALFQRERSKERLTPQALAFIQSLDPNQLGDIAKQQGLAPETIQAMQRQVMLLKHFGNELSLQDLFELMQKTSISWDFELPEATKMALQASLKAPQSLSQTDRNDLAKAEHIRLSLWRGMPVDPEDQIWYESYQQTYQQNTEHLHSMAFDHYKQEMKQGSCPSYDPTNRSRKIEDEFLDMMKKSMTHCIII